MVDDEREEDEVEDRVLGEGGGDEDKQDGEEDLRGKQEEARGRREELVQLHACDYEGGGSGEGVEGGEGGGVGGVEGAGADEVGAVGGGAVESRAGEEGEDADLHQAQGHPMFRAVSAQQQC